MRSPAGTGPRENRNAAHALSGAGSIESSGETFGNAGYIESTGVRDAQPRRLRLLQQLYECGPRPVAEFCLAIEAGADFDETLEDFTRIPPAIYRAIGASEIDLQPDLRLIDGGRR